MGKILRETAKPSSSSWSPSSSSEPATTSSTSITETVKGSHQFKIKGGYKRFFKRTALETSDYLKDDCLSVNCSVGVVRSHTEGPKIYSIAIPPSNIGHQFGQLLENGKGSDVSFEVDGEVFTAHKLVLAARSPVFRAQLYGPMKDHNTKCIKVEDIEAPVFKDMFVIIMFAGNTFDCTVIDWNRIVDIDAVMQTDGFEYLKESCPSVLTELLEYVARFTEHSDFMSKHRNEAILDGSDVNGRRVKQRL
ncbi:hypothetical protein TSUD_333140 [Trifolium subterraneum]|uniref:BTB domain-containing protein n=1 Tax=Trifolium subterraneum TaxID=3900 RepID=A0A2Z6MHS4_TRISU|nr:hypothetical protein TSUD_333140 [Trifolium subterraneum]